jgi:PAS domain S-box-containing protein
MPDLVSGSLDPFQTAEKILGGDEPLGTKLERLLQIISKTVGRAYYIVLLEYTYLQGERSILDEKSIEKIEEDEKIVIAAISLENAKPFSRGPKTLSGEEATSFFSQNNISLSKKLPPSLKYCYVAPLISGSIILGLFCTYRKVPFSDVEREEMNLFSTQIANALHSEFLKEKEPSELLKGYYEAMIHTTEDMVFTLDRAGRFTFVNRKGEELMGDTIIGKHFEDVLVPEDRERVRKEFKKRIKGEISPIYRIQVFDKHGERIWLEISGTPFFQNGTVAGTCGSARIITEKMQIEQQRQHLTRIATDILQRKNLREIMETVANAIHDYCGFGRVIISLLDEDFEATNVAFAGLTADEEIQAAQSHLSPGERKSILKEKFKVGNSYYIPHDKVPWGKLGVQSRLRPEQMKDWHPDDFLFIPLHGEHKRVAGLVSVDDPADGKAPTAESLAPVELFATQAAIAIENARLYQQIRIHAEELEFKVEERTRKREALLETSYRLRETTSWDKGMTIILEGITKGLGFENAELFLINEAKGALENIAAIGAEKKEDIPLDDLDYVAAQCVAEKKPINIRDAQNVTKQIKPVLNYFAWVPILTQDDVLGAISVYNEKSKDPISDEDLDDLLLFANQAAHFVESTRFLISPIVEDTLDTAMKYKLDLGESYLIESEQPTEAFDIFLDAVTHGIQGFSICRIHPKKVKAKYKLERTPVLWLSTIETEYSVDPKDLAKMNHMINEFLKIATNAMVLLEGIEYLIIQNNFEKVVKAMHSLNDYITMSNSRLLVPVNPKTLDLKELSILEKEFQVF